MLMLVLYKDVLFHYLSIRDKISNIAVLGLNCLSIMVKISNTALSGFNPNVMKRL